MTSPSLKTGADRILAKWGFTIDPSPESIAPLILDAPFVKQWEQDLAFLSRAVTRLAEDGSLGTGPEAAAFTHGAERIRSNHTPFIGRPDFILANGKPMLLELNGDSSVGGLVQVSELEALFTAAFKESNNLVFRSPMAALARFLKPLCPDPPAAILVLSSRSFSAYNREVCQTMADGLFAALAIPSHVAFVDEVAFEQFVRYKEEDIGLVLRMDVVIDGGAESANLAQFLIAAARTQTVVVSDSMFLDVEHKGSLAILRDLAATASKLLLPEEIEAILRIIPETSLLGQHKPKRHPDWEHELLGHQNEFVLKRMYSFGGSKTFVGRYLSPTEWDVAVDEALKTPSLWIAQEYVEPDRLVLNGDYQVLQPGREGVRCVVSPFVFDTSIGGFLCRTQLSESSGVLGLASGASMGFAMVAEKPIGPTL